MASSTSDDGNVAFAFTLSLASSAATVLGSLLPFVVDVRDTRWLGVSLSVSTGIMIYVSLVEIHKAGSEKFVEAKVEDNWGAMNPVLASSLSLFLGVLLAAGLEAFVHWIHPDDDDEAVPAFDAGVEALTATAANGNLAPPYKCCAISNGASDKEAQVHVGIEEPLEVAHPPLAVEKLKDTQHDKNLMRMTLLAGFAMALHNIPEGLVTFVTAIDSVELGVTICVAMAIHNIPEGIVVAVPVLYATGSRWKAFIWGAVAGLTEPLGSVIGYMVFKLSSVKQADGHSTLPRSVLGCMLNVVAGMLVFVTFVELLPTAHKYSSSPRVVAFALFTGMFFMSLSEIVLSLA